MTHKPAIYKQISIINIDKLVKKWNCKLIWYCIHTYSSNSRHSSWKIAESTWNCCFIMQDNEGKCWVLTRKIKKTSWRRKLKKSIIKRQKMSTYNRVLKRAYKNFFSTWISKSRQQWLFSSGKTRSEGICWRTTEIARTNEVNHHVLCNIRETCGIRYYVRSWICGGC